MFKGLENRDPNNWLTIALASFVGVMALTPLMILPILVFVYDEILGFGPDVAGRVSSAGLAGIAITTIIVALKTKHWSLGKACRIGMAAVVFFTTISLWLHEVWPFTFLVFLAGLGGGAAQAAVAAGLARTANTERAFGIYIGFQFALPAIGLFSIAWAFTWPYFLSIQANIDGSGTVASFGQFTNLVGNAAGPLMAASFVGSDGNYVGAIWLACGLFIVTLAPMLMIKSACKTVA